MKVVPTFLICALYLILCAAVVLGNIITTTNTTTSNQNTTADGKSSHRNLKLKPVSIPNRMQWDCNFANSACCDASCNTAICDGYCGSVTLQETLLTYGAYVSQGIIRRVVAFNDKDDARDILIDTHRPNFQPDLATTAQMLGLDTKTWYAKFVNKSGLKKFIRWAKRQINRFDAPVAMGVIFQGSKETTYDHIVTAMKSLKKKGLYFNDHYSSGRKLALVSSMPSSGSACSSSEYCFSRNMYGVALRRPTTISKESLVRLQIVNSDSSSLNEEPNWTCSLNNAVKLTMNAKQAYPTTMDNGIKKYVAIIFKGKSSQDVRDATDIWSGKPTKCYEMLSVNGVYQAEFDVMSDEAVYSKVVEEGSGCSLV
ncbi:predicted protein [Chaetoceros tenuissimus]|uniref:Uncharacterized protein n=1 Tax=Chaetoceros tenuissimus TaxID=426638 RepID=A0AAD3D2I2_9STRA|nr:predicted protein [Chaetoceros tenuissimus]